MASKKSKKSKKSFTLPQVLFMVGLVCLIGTILPSLLDAKSDVSILVGVMIVVSIFYAVIKYGKTFLSLVGIELDEITKED